MIFCNLTEKEFNKFASSHEQESFLQTIEWGNLRKIYNTKIHYVGLKEKNKVIAATMIMENKSAFGKNRLYAPRGYLIDYHNDEVLSLFTKEIIKFAKEHNAMYIKIDPNVIYQIRDIDGNENKEAIKDDLTINNLKKNGYIHSGFTLDLGESQSRWNFRLELNKPYEELKQQFSKSTKKNIESSYNKGLRIKKAQLEDLESMEEILIKTAERKNFAYRSLEYYTNMYNTLGDNVNIYLAYLDPEIYLDSVTKILNDEKENNKVIKDKMEKDLVGNKLKNQLETSNNLITKYEKEVEEAKKFKDENPNGKNIGTLISLKSGDEYLTLYSGILMEYKKFTPKYLMYNEHIKDAYENNFKYIDFYGITGHFNKEHKDYGMYEFKRGFGGNVIEMIGEFTLPTSKLYYVYNTLQKIKSKIKNK